MDELATKVQVYWLLLIILQSLYSPWLQCFLKIEYGELTNGRIFLKFGAFLLYVRDSCFHLFGLC